MGRVEVWTVAKDVSVTQRKEGGAVLVPWDRWGRADQRAFPGGQGPQDPRGRLDTLD